MNIEHFRLRFSSNREHKMNISSGFQESFTRKQSRYVETSWSEHGELVATAEFGRQWTVARQSVRKIQIAQIYAHNDMMSCCTLLTLIEVIPCEFLVS